MGQADLRAVCREHWVMTGPVSPLPSLARTTPARHPSPGHRAAAASSWPATSATAASLMPWTGGRSAHSPTLHGPAPTTASSAPAAKPTARRRGRSPTAGPASSTPASSAASSTPKPPPGSTCTPPPLLDTCSPTLRLSMLTTFMVRWRGVNSPARQVPGGAGSGLGVVVVVSLSRGGQVLDVVGVQAAASAADHRPDQHTPPAAASQQREHAPGQRRGQRAWQGCAGLVAGR